MRSFLHKVVLDNMVADYLIFLAGIVLILLFRKKISRYIAGVFFRMLKRTSWNIDEKTFVDLLAAPLHAFVIILLAFISFDTLKYPSAFNFEISRIPFKNILNSISSGVVVVAFIWLMLRCIDFAARILEQKANLTPNLSDDQLVVFFKDFFKVIVIFIGVLLLLKFAFHKNIGILLGGLSIVGAAIALSARESLENLIASFIIFFDKPFTHGDLVKVQAITGTVERIGLRSTRIRTDQKTYVTVPNKQMVDSILDNLSLRTQRKVVLTLEISSSTSYQMVTQLIHDIDYILLHRKDYIQTYSVNLTDITKNIFIIQIEYFTGAVAVDIYNDVRQEVNLSIIQIMEKMKVKLAGKDSELLLSPQ
jgi:MscS family membrane protein